MSEFVPHPSNQDRATLPGPNNNTTGILEQDLLSCQRLVIIDKDASTVQLTYFTIPKHLRSHPELFGIAHSTIA